MIDWLSNPSDLWSSLIPIISSGAFIAIAWFLWQVYIHRSRVQEHSELVRNIAELRAAIKGLEERGHHAVSVNTTDAGRVVEIVAPTEAALDSLMRKYRPPQDGKQEEPSYFQ